jgi:hypothetical protein
VGSRFHVVIARNRMEENHGSDGAISIDLPADFGEDYCIRVENNVVTSNEVGISMFYTSFKSGSAQFELVNNTLTGNRQAIGMTTSGGLFSFANTNWSQPRRSVSFRCAVPTCVRSTRMARCSVGTTSRRWRRRDPFGRSQ